jgi:hypothetical protein
VVEAFRVRETSAGASTIQPWPAHGRAFQLQSRSPVSPVLRVVGPTELLCGYSDLLVSYPSLQMTEYSRSLPDHAVVMVVILLVSTGPRAESVLAAAPSASSTYAVRRKTGSCCASTPHNVGATCCNLVGVAGTSGQGSWLQPP